MNIFAVVGSQRSGNTYKQVKKFEKEINKYGDFNFEYLNLWEENIKKCTGCHLCLTHGIEKCPLEDNIMDIKEKIIKSDAILLSSPVYVMNVTPNMKNFIDRLCSVCHRPEFIKQNGIVLTTVGGYGDKAVLKYLKEVLSVWGTQKVIKVGLQTPPVKEVPEKITEKNDKIISKKAEKITNNLLHKNKVNPSFSNILQFYAQRAIFGRDSSKDDFPADYNFYSELKDKKFHKNIDVGFFKSNAAKIISKIAMLFFD